MSYYLLGVHQSGHLLKISAFEKNYSKYKLFAIGDIPTNFDENKISEELRRWITTNLPNADQVKAVVAIPESRIFFNTLKIPKVVDAQIGETAKWELLSDAPIPLDTAIYGHKKLSHDAKSIEVLTLLVKEQVAEVYVSIFDKAGIDIQAIEPSSISYIRSAKEDFKKNTLFITLETGQMNLIIVKNKAPIFTTSFKVNMQDASLISADVLKETAAEAEKIIGFWENKHSEKIEQIVLSDDFLERFLDITNELSSFTKIPVIVSKDKNLHKFSIEGFNPSSLVGYNTAIGAALRVLSDESINLLPDRKKGAISRSKITEQKTKFAITAVIVNFVLILLSIVLLIIFNLKIRSLNDLTENTKTFVNNHQAQAYLASYNNLNRKVDIISDLMDEQVNVGDRLRLIASFTPNEITLTSIDLANRNEEVWSVKGVGDRNSVLAFYEKMKAESQAKNVTMPYSNFSRSIGDFELLITW